MKFVSRPVRFLILLLSLASLACSAVMPLAGERTARVNLTPTVEQRDGASGYPPRPRTGLRIAYVDTERNLWLWDENQEPKMMVRTFDIDKVRLSPGGEWIAYTRSKDRVREAIWVIRADSSGARLLMSEVMVYHAAPVGDAYAVVPFQLRWVAGTDLLAMSTWPIFDGVRTDFNRDLHLLDAETGEFRTIFARGEGGLFFLSPDGKRVAMASPGQVDLADVDGGNLLRGVLSFEKVYNNSLYQPLPVWSRDSRRVGVIAPPDQTGGGAVVWEVNADGSAPRRIGEIPAEGLYTSSFSPDLARVAYLQKAGGDAPAAFDDLWVADLKSGSAERIETGQLQLMNWSPDSRRLVYGMGYPVQPMVGMVGEKSEQMSNIRGAEQIRWIGEEELVFMLRLDDGWEIRRTRVGGESEVLVRMPKRLHHPTFEFAP